MDVLLAYLRTDALKPDLPRRIANELGADTVSTKIGNLTDASWGAYFCEENEIGDDFEEVVAAAEAEIRTVDDWLDGGQWAPER